MTHLAPSDGTFLKLVSDNTLTDLEQGNISSRSDLYEAIGLEAESFELLEIEKNKRELLNIIDQNHRDFFHVFSLSTDQIVLLSQSQAYGERLLSVLSQNPNKREEVDVLADDIVSLSGLPRLLSLEKILSPTELLHVNIALINCQVGKIQTAIAASVFQYDDNITEEQKTDILEPSRGLLIHSIPERVTRAVAELLYSSDIIGHIPSHYIDIQDKARLLESDGIIPADSFMKILIAVKMMNTLHAMLSQRTYRNYMLKIEPIFFEMIRQMEQIDIKREFIPFVLSLIDQCLLAIPEKEVDDFFLPGLKSLYRCEEEIKEKEEEIFLKTFHYKRESIQFALKDFDTDDWARNDLLAFFVKEQPRHFYDIYQNRIEKNIYDFSYSEENIEILSKLCLQLSMFFPRIKNAADFKKIQKKILTGFQKYCKNIHPQQRISIIDKISSFLNIEQEFQAGYKILIKDIPKEKWDTLRSLISQVFKRYGILQKEGEPLLLTDARDYVLYSRLQKTGSRFLKSGQTYEYILSYFLRHNPAILEDKKYQKILLDVHNRDKKSVEYRDGEIKLKTEDGFIDYLKNIFIA
ncbi:hypothetical protein COB57_05435 [Candidatus Peregrinibacteria bacterium]|nr:MAG: hypothetical protein COB57_05435 [Candidatus Peregrinibacteria bacterium]